MKTLQLNEDAADAFMVEMLRDGLENLQFDITMGIFPKPIDIEENKKLVKAFKRLYKYYSGRSI